MQDISVEDGALKNQGRRQQTNKEMRMIFQRNTFFAHIIKINFKFWIKFL